jgi:tRNA dimethylallyltransferase
MQVDPVSANRIHPNDPQRIQRALEVYAITGETMSSLYEQTASNSIPFNIVKIAVAPEDRSELHENIRRRVAGMLNKGFLEEVSRFFKRDDLHKNLPSMRAVGYRQLWEHLEGKLGYPQLEERIVIVTRQFAKRQFTWLRSDAAITWFNATDKKLLSKVLKYLNTVPI